MAKRVGVASQAKCRYSWHASDELRTSAADPKAANHACEERVRAGQPPVCPITANSAQPQLMTDPATDPLSVWLTASAETIASYRKMIDAAVVQLSDDEFFARPAPHLNSVAVLLRHLAGNLRSRWTDFLTTDGEKPDRNRDAEFLDWPGDRASLLAEFDRGWGCLAAVPIC